MPKFSSASGFLFANAMRGLDPCEHKKSAVALTAPLRTFVALAVSVLVPPRTRFSAGPARSLTRTDQTRPFFSACSFPAAIGACRVTNKNFTTLEDFCPPD